MKYLFFIPLFLILFTACERDQDNSEILKFYGDARDDAGYAVAAADNGYFICGQLTEVFRDGNYITGSENKVGIIKTDLNGNLIWQKFLGDKLPGSGSKVILLDDGSVVCTGQVTDTITAKSDIFVAKLDQNGTVTAQNILKADGNQNSIDILQTQEGFIILGTTDVENPPVTDSTGNNAGSLDILLVRVADDSHLTQLDEPMIWGFPWNDRGVSLKNDKGGGYIIAGTTDRYAFKGRKNDILLFKVNTLGSVTKYIILYGAADEYAADLEVLDDGYLIAGTTGSESVKQSAYFARVPFNIFNIYSAPVFPDNPAKDKSWSVNSISRYKHNYFVAAGKEGSGSAADMLFFLIDEGGNMIEGNEKVSGSTGIQVAYDVVSDYDDYIIAVGKNSYETNSMISLLKFRF